MKPEQSVDPKDVQVMNWTVFHGGIVGVGIAPHAKGPGHASAALRTFALEDIELPGIYTDNTVAPTWLIATKYSTNPDLVQNPEKVIAYLERYLLTATKVFWSWPASITYSRKLSTIKTLKRHQQFL